jgi:hypothetical protein
VASNVKVKLVGIHRYNEGTLIRVLKWETQQIYEKPGKAFLRYSPLSSRKEKKVSVYDRL